VLCTNKLTTFPKNIPTCPTTCDIDNCNSFISDGVCGKCNSDYFLSFYLDSCINTCTTTATTNPYYHDCDDSNYCLLKNDCVSNCNQCITPQECQVCADGYYLTDEKLCAKCAAECTTCSNVKTCTVCASTFYLTNVGSCIACTSDGQTIANPNCNICALANCKTCSGETNNDCSQCRTGFYLLTVGGVKSCDQCQVGYTIFGTTCRKCTDFLCIYCDSDGLCLECSQGYFLKTGGICDPCISSISIGWYRTTINRVDSCVEADNSKRGTCIEFAPSNASPGTICTDCGTKKIKFSTALANTECVTCDGTNEGSEGKYCYLSNECTPNCDKCFNSYQCQNCASGYFITPEKVCSPCKSDCSKCVWSDACTECADDRCLLGDECVLYTTEGIASCPGSKKITYIN
jgi:hypothetical protein